MKAIYCLAFLAILTLAVEADLNEDLKTYLERENEVKRKLDLIEKVLGEEQLIEKGLGEDGADLYQRLLNEVEELQAEKKEETRSETFKRLLTELLDEKHIRG